MMNYEIFKEVVKEKFVDYMPEKFKGMELVAEPVEKVNVTLDGIILREEGRNISPTIYINDMYKKYQECGDLEETLMAACDFMERAYEQTPVVDVDSIMRDANEKIVFQLINTEQNKTFLEQVPHREFQDLSIVYKVIISADKAALQDSRFFCILQSPEARTQPLLHSFHKIPVRNLSVSRHCCLCQTALTICTNGFCYRYGWNPSPLKCGICQSSLLYTQGFQQLHTGQHSLLWQALHP